MSAKKRIIGASILVFTLILLVLINLDIFSFTQEFPTRRSFFMESDEKGNQPITSTLSLREGNYQITFSGENEDKKNGYIIYLNGETFETDTFDTGEIHYTVDLPVETKMASVQIGVSYAHTPAVFRIEHVTVHSDHVLTKESILRHAVISLWILLLSVFLICQFCFPGAFCSLFHGRITQTNECVVLYLIGITLLSSIPILNTGFPQSTDLFYHLMRIEGIKDSLLAGYFPARIHLFALKNYGYGSGFYYPDFFLYFPALLRMLGFSILASWKIFTILTSFIALLVMFLFIHRISQSTAAGLISATLYAFAAYRLLSIYYRGAVGEAQSYMFMPLILWGLYEILHGRSDRWLIFAAGFTGLMLCHSISLALNGILVLLILAFYSKTIIRNPKILAALGKAFLVTMGLSAYFWLPMLEQLQTNSIKAGFLYSGNSTPLYYHHVLDFSSLFSVFAQWSNIYQQVYFGYPLLLIPLVFVIFILIFRGKICPPRLLYFLVILLFCGVIFLLAGTKVFPWQYFSWLQSEINYLWRGFMVASCAFSAVGGLLCLPILKKRRGKILLPFVLILCLAGILPMFIDSSRNNTYPGRLFQLNDNWILGEEWLPLHADKNFIDKNGNNVLLNGKVLEGCSFDRDGLSFSFAFDGECQNSCTFEVPLLYYTGYQALLSSSNGEKVKVQTYQGPHGLVSFSASNVPAETILVWYQKTSVQWISEFLSLLTLILIFVIKKRPFLRQK